MPAFSLEKPTHKRPPAPRTVRQIKPAITDALMRLNGPIAATTKEKKRIREECESSFERCQPVPASKIEAYERIERNLKALTQRRDELGAWWNEKSDRKILMNVEEVDRLTVPLVLEGDDGRDGEGSEDEGSSAASALKAEEEKKMEAARKELTKGFGIRKTKGNSSMFDSLQNGQGDAESDVASRAVEMRDEDTSEDEEGEEDVADRARSLSTASHITVASRKRGSSEREESVSPSPVRPPKKQPKRMAASSVRPPARRTGATAEAQALQDVAMPSPEADHRVVDPTPDFMLDDSAIQELRGNTPRQTTPDYSRASTESSDGLFVSEQKPWKPSRRLPERSTPDATADLFNDEGTMSHMHSPISDHGFVANEQDVPQVQEGSVSELNPPVAHPCRASVNKPVPDEEEGLFNQAPNGKSFQVIGVDSNGIKVSSTQMPGSDGRDSKAPQQQDARQMKCDRKKLEADQKLADSLHSYQGPPMKAQKASKRPASSPGPEGKSKPKKAKTRKGEGEAGKAEPKKKAKPNPKETKTKWQKALQKIHEKGRP